MRKPYYRKDRKAWYVKSSDGRTQTFLHEEEDKAYEIWQEMRTAQHPEAATATFAVIAANFLSSAKKSLDSEKPMLSAKTYRSYQDYLVGACEEFGAVRVRSLRKYHVIKWLDDNPTWGTWARRGAAASVQRAINWAVDQGYLSVNPVAKLGLPKGGRRENLIAEDIHAKMMQAADEGRKAGGRLAKLGRRAISRDRCFRPVLIALRHSGTRPGMVAAVQIADVTPCMDAWVLREHKTEETTGKPLIVRLSPCLATLTRIILSRRSSGPLFLNSKGEQWTSNAIGCRMTNLQKKLKLPPKTVAYSYRHTWTTNAIVNGVDLATVATMLGHQDLRMIAQHYAHLEQQPEHLKAAAAQAMRRKA